MKNDKMSAVAEEIIKMEIEDEIIDKLSEKFYEIARKHCLRWGTKHEHGTTGANFEWSMAKDFFLHQVFSQLQYKSLFQYPDDLKHYDEEEDIE